AGLDLTTRQAVGVIGALAIVGGLLSALGMYHVLPAYLDARLEAFANLSSDPNASWRLNAGAIAINMATQHPITGMGSGQLDLLPYGIAPHNSLVSILYQLGVPGELAFLSINSGFYLF